MKREGNLFWINPILHIAEHKRVLTHHRGIKSEYALLVLSATEDDLVVWIENEEIN